MFLHQSAYLDHNLYRAGYSGQMHQEYKNQPREEIYVDMHIQQSNRRFGNGELQNCYQLRWVASQVEVVAARESAICFGQVEVHQFLSLSIVSVDFLQCRFGKEDIRPDYFDKA